VVSFFFDSSTAKEVVYTYDIFEIVIQINEFQ